MPQLPSEFIDAETLLLTSKTFTEVTRYGMNTHVDKQGAPHQWLLEWKTPPLTPESKRQLNGFLNALDGRYNTFTIAEPLPLLGEGLSDLTVATGAKGATVLTMTTARVNSVAMKLGDVFKFSNHDKVYQCAADYNTDGNLTIYPPLQQSAVGATVQSATFSVRLTSDANSLELDAKRYLTQAFIEAEENV